MTWRTALGAAAAPSRISPGALCNADCYGMPAQSRDGQPLHLFASSGASSAARGGEGAEVAVAAAIAAFRQIVFQGVPPLDAVLARRVVRAIRESLQARASEQGHSLRDYACAFVAVLSVHSKTLVFRVGDAGAVIDVGQGLNLALAHPPTGIGLATVLTDSNALEEMEVYAFDEEALRAGVFTAGVRSLALEKTGNVVNSAFFLHFFSALDNVQSSVDEAAVNEELLKVLCSSPSANEQIDGDRAVAMVAWKDLPPRYFLGRPVRAEHPYA